MARIVVGLVILGVGAALLAWAGWRLARPRRRDDVEWQKRHRVLDMLLTGISFRSKPYPYERVGAVSMLLSGFASLVLGIVVLSTH